MKIISGILLAIAIYINGSHAWPSITNSMKPAAAKMFSDLGISQNLILPIGLVSLAICLLLLFTKTFFLGNLLSAIVILLMMALALQINNLKIALIEIPFLATNYDMFGASFK